MEFYHQSIGILNFRKFYYLTSLLFLSCQNNEESIVFNSKIVVEGAIEENSVATVILSNSISSNVVLDENNIDKYFIKAARVTVSDGTISETLRLKTMLGYIPPYIYIGEKIIGKKGGTYSLTVEYLNETVKATTSIPSSVAINEITFSKIDDQKGKMTIQFDDPAEKNYYQIASRVIRKDSLFIPALYGNIDDASIIENPFTTTILKGIKFYPEKDTDTYFPIDKVIEIKLNTMDKSTFDFWNSWQNEVLNGQNPLFPSSFNLKTNIIGGYGIWAGYGSSVKAIRS